MSLIVDEVHHPQKPIPGRMAPLIFVGTLLTHLVGGSAGREGTAVQMGASLSAALGQWLRVSLAERKILMVAGMASGFATAVGAPWAGFLFGLEVLTVGQLHFFAFLECLIAVGAGTLAFSAWGAEHTHYFIPQIPSLNLTSLWPLLGPLLAAGLAFGLLARVFIGGTHGLEKALHRWLPNPIYRPAVGGILLAALFWIEGTFRYCGLGIEVIQESLRTSVSLRDSLFKLLFTTLTLAFGFKGGEFIPLVFMGSTLGSALAPGLGVDPGFVAALGMAATFGAAGKIPLTCWLLAIEMFGLPIAPYAAIVGITSYWCSGKSSIYKTQKQRTKQLL